MHSALVHMLHLHMLADCLSAFVLRKEAIELANAYGNVFGFFFICMWPYFYFFQKLLLGHCVEMTNSKIFSKKTLLPLSKSCLW